MDDELARTLEARVCPPSTVAALGAALGDREAAREHLQEVARRGDPTTGRYLQPLDMGRAAPRAAGKILKLELAAVLGPDRFVVPTVVTKRVGAG